MNRPVIFGLSLAIVLVAVAAEAQVVQLPTFRVFSVGTTVSIPDGGAAYLGGVTRSSSSSSSRGVPGLSQVPGLNRLFTNRSIESSVSSSHAYATATIIDHAEMDRALLAEAAARRGEVRIASESDRRAAYLSEFMARSEVPTRTAPLAAKKAAVLDSASRLADTRSRHEAEMAAHLERAELAEAAGHLGAAKCSYSVLARRGSDEQKQLATRRLAALDSRATDGKLASREH